MVFSKCVGLNSYSWEKWI